jgi:hypothetical protein
VIALEPQHVLLAEENALVVKRAVPEPEGEPALDASALRHLNEVTIGDHFASVRTENQKTVNDTFHFLNANGLGGRTARVGAKNDDKDCESAKHR